MILVCRAVLGLFVLAYPLLSGIAQKPQGQKSQNDQNAIEVVRESVVSSVFYDTLQARETDWVLVKANHLRSGGTGGTIVSERSAEGRPDTLKFSLSNDKLEAHVAFYEYYSVNGATSLLEINIQQGRIEPCKGDECGDEGQKIYRENGELASLSFRKGRFFVYISCNSEETAKRFAGYALTAVANR